MDQFWETLSSTHRVMFNDPGWDIVSEFVLQSRYNQLFFELIFLGKILIDI